MSDRLQDLYPHLVCTSHDLKDLVIARIESLLAEPTADKWEDCHKLVLKSVPFLDLWTAVQTIDPAFPDFGRIVDSDGRILVEWKRVPDTQLLEKALRYAASQE
jgi:hypothetical protein